MSIRVYIADDVPDVRELPRAQLASDPDVEVVGEAADGRTALAGILDTEPDVAVLDLSMPRLDGLEVLRRLRSLRAAVRVLLVSAGTPAQDSQVRDAGGDGFLSKPVPAATLRAAVRTAASATHRTPAVS